MRIAHPTVRVSCRSTVAVRTPNQCEQAVLSRQLSNEVTMGASMGMKLGTQNGQLGDASTSGIKTKILPRLLSGLVIGGSVAGKWKAQSLVVEDLWSWKVCSPHFGTTVENHNF